MKLSELKTIIALMEMSLSEDISDKARASKAIERLKNELKVDSKDYWKTTHKALSSISERLVRLASRVGNLR